MIKSLNQHRIAFLMLGGAFLLFLLLAIFSEATYDAGDGIRHYLVSRYCWAHPDLLLYSWGKPFFTLVSSPFSQLGLIGINVFNILCGIGSAWYAFRIAQHLKLHYALLAIPFLLFTPSYFPTLNSGLTEPFFGFVLILSIYLIFAERYAAACIVVSFLPFVRTEGNLILPLFFILMIYRRQYLKSLLLGFGTLAYSVVGYFYYGDFLWVKNQNPYNGENRSFYGSGELLHFVNNHNFLWGSMLALLFIAGVAIILWLAFDQIRSKTLENGKLPEEVLLIYGAFAVYFVAHSFMWWKGLANSLGLLRVMAGVMPCSALICLRGLNLVSVRFIRERKIVEAIFIGLILLWIIRSPFKHEYFPFRLDPEQKLVKEAGDWYRSSPFAEKKVYYLYPYLAHVLEVDSFDPNKVGELWGLYPSIKEWGISSIPDSTIVFWDAHFGPNECKIPLDMIMNDPNFQLIRTFKPEQEFTTLGGYKFEIHAFMKLPKPKEMKELSVDMADLESIPGWLQNTAALTDKKAFSGKYANILSPDDEYSVTVMKKGLEIPQGTLRVDVSLRLSDPSGNSGTAVIVMSIDDPASGKNLFWEGKPIVATGDTEWKDALVSFNLDRSKFSDENTMKIYVWNKEKKEFLIDDLKISYRGY